MSKFADDTKLCHRARTPDDVMELQEDIDTLVEWANKWQMSFNVDKCSVIHIGHNNMQSNYNMSNQQWDLGIIIMKDLKWRKQRKAAKWPTEYWGSLPAISCTNTKTDPPIMQINSLPTSRTCSAILVPTFKVRH